MKKFFIILILFFPLISQAALTDSIKAAWNFNQPSGDAVDVTGGGFTAVNTNVTFSGATPIKNNYSIYDALTDGFAVSGLASYNPTGDVSINFWVYKATDSTVGLARCVLFSNGDIDISIAGSGDAINKNKVQLTIWTGSNQFLYSTTVIPNNKWTMVTVTNTSGTWDIYVNAGASEASGARTVTWETPAADFTIGTNEAFLAAMIGNLDLVTIWDRSITAAERTTLYASGRGCEYKFLSCLFIPSHWFGF